MKISLKWIQEFVDVRDFLKAPQGLVEQLTGAGLEVEAIDNPARGLENVVVGQIRELAKHPAADRLTVCQVETGRGVQQIVCGATNHKAGDKVAVALPGAVLPGGIAIRETVLRGEKSCGMLCSRQELGLAGESDGILILPAEAPVGENFALYQGLDDVILELKVTPNRADCLSHFGVAREIGVLLGRPCEFKKPKFRVGSFRVTERFGVEVKNSEACPRYAAREVRGLSVGESPDWVRKRLQTLGLNAINNVVDATNYVMLELGQPLHAFDAREISGHRIIVADSSPGEAFVKLDGVSIALTGRELTIRNESGPMALAGVVGGQRSGVREDTREVVLESAFFQPMNVRQTSRRLGIETDSAYRFARGVDRASVPLALDRVCQLLSEWAGGEASADAIDAQPVRAAAVAIDFRPEEARHRLGFAVSDQILEQCLARLSCSVKAGVVWRVTPPSYRGDLRIEEDLIEEVARLVGYEHIPETMPAFDSEPTNHEQTFDLERVWSRDLAAAGFNECVSYHFVGEATQANTLGDVNLWMAAGLNWQGDIVKIVNPLSDEMNVMRRSLVPQLLEHVGHNLRHGVGQGRLFELGRVFYRIDKEYFERTSLGLVAFGRWADLWSPPVERPLVFDLKGALEGLLRGRRIEFNWRACPAEAAPEFLHPGQSATLVVQGQPVGVIGTLHPSLAEAQKIRVPVTVAEIDFEKIRGEARPSFRVRKVSPYPVVERDLAFVVSLDKPVADIEREIRRVCGPRLRELAIVDIFQGGALEKDQRSVAFRMWLQDDQATLTDQDLSALQEAVIKSVSERLGVQVRA
jgi:phenylalanyl-tRNA synthetase beta chain